MNDVEKTLDLFGNGLTCSQAVLTVFGEPYGLDMEMVAKLGRPLGGGMGHCGRTCGAVSAAVLILGLAKDHPDEAEARKVSFSSVQTLFGSSRQSVPPVAEPQPTSSYLVVCRA